MNAIELTIKRVGGDIVTPYSSMVPIDSIQGLAAVGTDARFFAPFWNSKLGPIEVVVEETYAQVKSLIGLTSQSYCWGVIDMAVVGDRTIATHDVKDFAGNALKVPKGAIIKLGMAFVKTTFVSATNAGTIALGIEVDSAAGLKAAIAINNGAAPWTAPNKTALLPVNTVATFLGPASAELKVQFVVAVEAMTAGKMLIYLEYAVDPT